MTERKPPGVSWESWIERQIREARERGEFDDLPSRGKRIANIEDPYDELWWVRQMVQREGVEVLPPTLALRKERDAALARIEQETTESAVRAIVAEINAKIVATNRMPPPGPPTTLMPLDVELVVQRWRDGHPG